MDPNQETDSDSSPSTTPTSAATSDSETTAINEPPLAEMLESLKLEHHLLRVPFEQYKKTILSNHRAAKKEVSSVLSSVANSTDSSDLSRENVVSILNNSFSRLQGLKRKLEEGSQIEDLLAKRCQARLDRLNTVDVHNLSEWNDILMKRILVDYMLRMSCYDTAAKLAESFNIQDLVDINVFQEAKLVIDSLRNKDLAPALAWCADNKSRLKKSQSKFEFQLRQQQYIELVRAGNNMDAVTFARKYLAPWAASHVEELQHVFGALAFSTNTQCARYKVLFEPKQWENLVDQFKEEFCRLYGMTPKSLLNIYLNAGLIALKSPFCDKGPCTSEDPLVHEAFRKPALHLPYLDQDTSKTLCYITKEIMDTENFPQVLPNGYVYSFLALLEMAYKNKGNITCPRTGYVCNHSNVKRVYI